MSKISHRSIFISVTLSIVLSLSFLHLFSPPLHAQSYFSIWNYQLVSSKRISATVWQYTYTADIRNGSGTDVPNLTATVTSSVSTTQVINNTLNFGNVPPGYVQTSTNTFSLQVDRRYPLDLSQLSWTFNGHCPSDSCHLPFDPAEGCTDLRTVLSLPWVSPTLDRFIWSHPDGRVDLYYDEKCAPSADVPWHGWLVQANEYPHTSYCGPTAGINLLDWYGEIDRAAGCAGYYDQFGSEMNVNQWMSFGDVVGACACACSPCPYCLCPEPTCWTGCTVLSEGYETILDIGTHPDDMERTLRKHQPARYVLYRHQGEIGLATFEAILGEGNPIVVLIWTGSTLHWTVVTGTYDFEGTVMVRFANNDVPNQTWSWFVHTWSFAGLNWPLPNILSDLGIHPFVGMYYEKPTEITAGQEILRGQSITSVDGRFELILDIGGNLVLYPLPWPGHDNHLWRSNTAGSDAQRAIMQSDGNFVIYDSHNHALWASGTCCNPAHPGAYLALQNDGNLVMYDSNNDIIWETNTGGH